MRHFSLPFGALALLLALLVTACGEDEPTLNYTIPTSYADFSDVNYDGQLQRLAQLQELGNYLKSAANGTEIDADRAKAMYNNDAATAGWNGTYDASKELAGKTLESVRADFETYIDAAAVASRNTGPAVNGQAGVAVSNDGAKRYQLDERGVEWAQVVEKGLMGACFYYQAVAVYLGPDKMNVDNETVTPGEGTEMEHHWDEAFGYLGVPRAFPSDRDGLIFWGKYSNDRDAMMGTNQPLMDALLKGRAAISNKDLATRDEAIPEVRAAWEQVVVGTAIHYLNSALAAENDFAIRAHALSEAVAFIYSLQFNPERGIDIPAVNELLATLGGSADFAQMNFYNTENADIEAARTSLSRAYGLETVAGEL
jgi:hypothetical protein